MTEDFKQAEYSVVEMWECQWDKIVKATRIKTYRQDLKHMKPLQPRDGYFSGRVNAAKLYYKCQHLEFKDSLHGPHRYILTPCQHHSSFILCMQQPYSSRGIINS